ncbi:hypothetical protein ACFYSD_03945 [Streptosporangium sandarakinum]
MSVLAWAVARRRRRAWLAARWPGPAG